MDANELLIEISAENKHLIKKLQQSNKAIRNFTKTSDDTAKKSESIFSKMGKIIANNWKKGGA